MIALAEWAPECYRDVDGNYLQPKIELAILHGATVGLGPIASVHAIALISGIPSIWGDGALSVIEHSGLLEDMAEDYEVDAEEGLTAICTMKRRDRATPIVTRFSMTMAERAGLTRSEGPWQTYPERMLRMRARSWTMRDAFADVLRGLQLREEVEDYRGRGGERSHRAPPGEDSSQRGPRQYASPRPTLIAATPAATLSATPPPPTSKEGDVGRSAGQPKAEADQDHEAHTLIDADGIFLEIVGVEALRAGFERILFDKHLSPNQIIGLWESNEAARTTIERLFGPHVLGEAEEHLKSFQGVTNPTPDDHSAPVGTLPNATASQPGQDHPLELNRSLMLEISPTWGIQKIFQQYRAALNALDDSSKRSNPTIARFRQANIGVEQQLRTKLSSRMWQIDAIYQSAGLEP